LIEIKTFIGNFMHKTALAEDDFKRVRKALNDEIELEDKIVQRLRDKRFLVNGTSYRIVRKIVIYDRGRSPGLVWEHDEVEPSRRRGPSIVKKEPLLI
jgi:hypothetical protein